MHLIDHLLLSYEASSFLFSLPLPNNVADLSITDEYLLTCVVWEEVDQIPRSGHNRQERCQPFPPKSDIRANHPWFNSKLLG